MEVKWNKTENCKTTSLFGAPGKLDPPDYDGYWLKRNDWTRGEALFLLHNICPKKITVGDGYGLAIKEFIERLVEPQNLKLSLSNVFELLNNAICAGGIKYRIQDYRPPTLPQLVHITPKEVVQWAHSTGFAIPDPLKVLLDNRDIPGHNIFKRTGETWTFYYSGMKKKIEEVKNLKGFSYIQNLLKNPYTEFDAFDLDASIFGCADTTSAEYKMQNEPDYNAAGTAGRKLSRVLGIKLKQRKNKLEEQLEKELRDPELRIDAEGTQREISEIEEELEARNNDESKMRDAIRNAINRARQKIAERSGGDTALFLHLKNTIPMEWPIVYRPDNKTNWQT